MPRRKKRILALDPGTRHIGYAVFEGPELIYHGVVTLSADSTPEARFREARRVFLRFLRDFRPAVVGVEKAFFPEDHDAGLLTRFIAEVKALCRQEKLEVFAVAPNTMKRAVTGDGHATKMHVACVVVSLYPELSAYLIHGQKWKQRFHCNMFDAVGVGLTVHSPQAQRGFETCTHSGSDLEAGSR